MTLDQKDLGELDAVLAHSLRERSVPGASVSLIEAGEVVSTRSRGERSSHTQDPCSPDTVFEAASMGKALTGYITMRLVERGDLDLDEPLSHAGRVRIDDGRVDSISARHALTHQTGLWRDDWSAPAYFEHDPGVRFKYSNAGVYALQEALEDLTGLSLQDLARELVWAPLGMKDTSFTWRADYETKAATPHDDAGSTLEKWRPETALAPTSLHSTAPDFARLVAALLAPDRYPDGLGPAGVEEMLRPHVEVHEAWGGGPPDPGSSWGLGWGIQPAKPASFWHWGWNDGFMSFAVGWPEQARGVVAFTNGMNGLWVCKDVVTWFSGAVHPSFRWLEH